MKKRITEIDVAKGLVILLMVLGHSGIPEYIRTFIYAFHMPFFFVIFGFTSNFDVGGTGEYINRKARHLLIPFGVYLCVNVFLRSAYYEMSPYCYIQNHIYLGCESALWFVPVLFLSAILSKIFLKYMENLVVLLILLFTQSLINFYSINLPWSLSVLPISTAFVVMGSYLKRLIPNYPNIGMKKYLFAFFCFLASLFVFFVSEHFRLEMKDNTSTDPINILFLTALVGSVVVINFSACLKNKLVVAFFQFWGKNTFLVMAFSGIIIKYLNLIHLNMFVKYVLLFCLLSVLIYIKNKITFFKKLNL